MDTNENSAVKKFLQKTQAGSFKDIVSKRSCKNKPIRRIADPRISRYRGNYYWYRRGTDQPKHLGTPDFILEAVVFYRYHNKEKNKNGA